MSAADGSTGELAKEDIKQIIVEFDRDDANDPRQWSGIRKWRQVVLLTALTFLVQFTVSSYSSAEEVITASFHTTKEVAILGESLVLLTYAITPMLIAPLAEVFGRRPIYLAGFSGFLCFTIPAGATSNLAVFLVFRFLAGLFGCVGNTMVAGSITDMFSIEAAGRPMIFYIVCGLLSSTPLGPLIGGLIVTSLGYRWIFWIQCVVGTAALFLFVLFLRETRPVVLLKKRAVRMNTQSGPGISYKAKGDDSSSGETVKIALKIPWQMMLTDLTIALFSLWLAFAWGLAYGMLQSIALIFRTQYRFTTEKVGLVHVSSLIALGLVYLASLLQERHFRKQRASLGEDAAECRLELACAGSIIMTGGLFFYAWTSNNMSPFPAIVAVGHVFFGIATVYYSVFLYVCDNYADRASSALSAAGFWRNMFAAAFPLFTNQMYTRLGYNWASSLLAFISIPVGASPFLLYIYGAKIRRNSKWIES